MGNSQSNGISKRQTKLEKKYGLVSGSSERSDGQVQAGWASLKGKRPQQEDVVYCSFDKSASGQEVGCFGVFDGHGGPCASRFVADNLFPKLLEQENFDKNLFVAVESAYLATDQEYVERDSATKYDDGTTAVTAVLVGKRLVTAHVGDTRAVLCERGTAVPLTDDHKPDRVDEQCRIQAQGGSVVFAGTWRVCGVLAVSRSFGNRMMKHLIIPHPEIREDVLHKGNSILVIASDGLWDVLRNQEALDLAGQHSSPEAAARALTEEAYLRGTQDNVSVVVVFFKFNFDQNAN